MTLRIAPEPLGDELPRPRLVERLVERFSHAVTCVVGGAGFGKSTLVAQAVRHNQTHPLGMEAWLSCRPGDEAAEHLGARLLAALATVSTDEPVGRLIAGSTPATIAAMVERAMVDASPLDVSIVLDDVHLVPAGSSGDELLGAIVRRLPDNGHLVLVSRVAPTLPLARLRASGRVLDVTEADLAFTEAEVRALARASGRDDAAIGGLSELGGWPALVRLGLVAPHGADRDFLVEEVLASLDQVQRATLFALTLLGPADDAAVAHVIGRSVRVADVLVGVPLVWRAGDDRHGAHQLWDAAVRASFDEATHRRMHARAIERLLADDQPARAAQAALAVDDLDELDRIALRVTRAQLNHIPVDTVRPWLSAVPDDLRGPALRVLDALVRYTTDSRDAESMRLLDEVMADARAADDFELESTALAAAAVIAHARQDLARLFPLAIRATELEPNGDPVLDVLRAALPAIEADLRGDPDAVLDALSVVPWERLPVSAAQLTGRLLLQAFWMAGRAAESVPFADRWYGGTEGYLGGLSNLARWFAGSPTPAITEGIGLTLRDGTNDRDRFVGTCFLTVIAAARGDAAWIEQAWTDGRIASLAFDNARDDAHLTYATAARLVAEGDEPAAQAVFARHLERWGDDPLGERHLRRFPSIGYVLSPELTKRWDAAPLGPSHESARASARALLELRDGRAAGVLPPPPAIVSHLPLRWSIELAARLAAGGDERAATVLQVVNDVVGQAAIDELARRAAPGDDQVPGAADLLARVPRRPSGVTAIRVLGDLEVSHDGVTSDVAELRRGRVRQLLALVVLERRVSRDRVLTLLWPDLAPDAASKNLRVTLTHLRKVLEPDRPPGTDGFHLRVDSMSIRLHASEHLCVDAWDAASLEQQLESTDELDVERELLRRLVELWRGDPFAELADLPETAGSVEHVRRRHVECLLRLGELHVAAGGARAAKQVALQALEVDPYCEQAHRLSIAADLRLDDAGAVRRSMARLSEAMEELGVDVSPATRMLLHQTSQLVRAPVRRAGAP